MIRFSSLQPCLKYVYLKPRVLVQVTSGCMSTELFDTTAVHGIGLEKSSLENICTESCKLCIWEQIIVKSQKMSKNMVLGVLRVFSAEKPHFLLKYLNYYRCMNNYSEIIGPSLNYGPSRKNTSGWLLLQSHFLINTMLDNNACTMKSK